MTRNSAREIAVHIIFALGFDNRSAQEVLEAELNKERFQELAEELPLYEQFPNEKQEKYIRTLVQGVFAHGPELDDCISRYSVGWAFARIPRMAAAIMRTAMYEVLYMQRWRWLRNMSRWRWSPLSTAFWAPLSAPRWRIARRSRRRIRSNWRRRQTDGCPWLGYQQLHHFCRSV